MSPLLRLLLCALLLSFAARAQNVLDVVDMASSVSLDTHQVGLTHAGMCREQFEIGTLVLPVSGIRLAPGGRVNVRMKPGDGRPHRMSLVLTFGTAPRDYGKRQAYSVRLNGREAYHATERDPGGGLTRSIVLDVPGESKSVDVEVAADTGSAAPVTVSSVRCHDRASFSSIPDSSSRFRMGLALLTSEGYGYSLDAPTMRRIFQLQPRSPYLEPQLALVYNFCERNEAANVKEINRLADMAEETGIPLRIAFQFHWGGLPRGVPDSAGVTFSDPPYQMVTYDPDDAQDDPGLAAVMGDRYDVRFGLSIPNIWSDTPWLTFNNPRLNRFRKARLKDVLSAWHAARKRLELKGKANLIPPELSTGEETVYWAKGVNDSKYTTVNGGKPRANLMADFNPFVVADALRDGVVLDPRAGLDESERWWLHTNMARWQQKIVDWMMEASPPPPILPGDKISHYASDLVRRNIYTEPYAMPLYPMMDVTLFHPGLEVGYVRDGRSGGEYWSGATILPWLQKERERGRIALPNVECTVTDDAQLVACLRAAYAFGARFTTLYNWHPRPNTAELLKAFADSIERAPGLEWLPEAPGRRDVTALDTALSRGPIVFTRRYAAQDVAFGVNRIELFPDFSEPAQIRITLRDDDPKEGESAAVTIVPALSPRGHEAPIVVDLPTFFRQEPNHRYELIVEVVKGGRFALAPDGLIAARLRSDLVLERSRSLLIEDWQDAADLLTSLRERHTRETQSRFATEALKEAFALFTSGSPREAYQAAIRAEQLSLPCALEVSAPGGTLTPYPIKVRCPGGPVYAVITAWKERSSVVSLTSAVAQTVTISLRGVTRTATLSPNEATKIKLESGK